MKKETYAFVRKHGASLLKMLQLNHFRVYIATGKTKASMDIQVDYTYLRAYVRIGKDVHEAYARGDHDYVVECLCHELTHIIVGIPMHKVKHRAKFLEQEESAVELLSRHIFELYKLKGGMK